MSLPFLPLPHRLRPGDVLPVQLVNRLGERLADAHALFTEQHRGFDPRGGAHVPIGQPIASRLYARPAGALTKWDFAKWGELPPVWSYGPWDGDASWVFWGTDAVRIEADVSGLSTKVQYRARAFIEMDPALGDESKLVFGLQGYGSTFAFAIPLDILAAANLVCIQVF